MSKTFTLDRSERIKSRKTIEALFDRGKGFTVSPFRAICLWEGKGLNVGVAVSARNFKKAADRNRIKRQTREAYRLQKNELKDLLTTADRGLQVFLTYQSKQKEEFNVIRTAVGRIIEKLIKKLREDISPNT